MYKAFDKMDLGLVQPSVSSHEGLITKSKAKDLTVW